jgi:transcriptional regulator with XRE-family HTH domain
MRQGKISKLRKLRESRGLRQIDVAMKAGICPTTYWHMERGDRASSLVQLKVCQALGVNLSDLL